MTPQPLEFPHQRTPTAPAPRLNIRKVVTTYKVEPRQCKQNGELPDIDYSEHPAFAHAAIHNYLRNCNCQTCIKNYFKLKSVQMRVKYANVFIIQNVYATHVNPTVFMKLNSYLP